MFNSYLVIPFALTLPYWLAFPQIHKVLCKLVRKWKSNPTHSFCTKSVLFCSSCSSSKSQRQLKRNLHRPGNNQLLIYNETDWVIICKKINRKGLMRWRKNHVSKAFLLHHLQGWVVCFNAALCFNINLLNLSDDVLTRCRGRRSWPILAGSQEKPGNICLLNALCSYECIMNPSGFMPFVCLRERQHKAVASEYLDVILKPCCVA